jgi:glycosyltransferase involved in cell wall biosynthesis
MKRVVYFHNTSALSGGERSLLTLWSFMDRDRYQLSVILPEEGPLSLEARRLGVEVDLLKVPSWRPWQFFDLIRTAVEFRKVLQKRKADIVHSYTPRNNLLASIVGKWDRVPVIWHERNIPLEREPDMTRKFFSMPDAVICNSRAVAKRFDGLKDADQKVRVILNGVDTSRFVPVSSKDQARAVLGWAGRPVAGIVSNLNARKNVEFFLEVAALAVRECPTALFVVVGGGFADGGKGRLETLQQKAARLGISDHVHFTGFREDVRPYLNAFDVLCAVTAREACSRGILESMASATAVLAVHDGGNPELVEDGRSGVLRPLEDLPAFVSALVRLLRDPLYTAALGREGRKRALDLFDARRNALETEAVYAMLLKQKGV